MKFFQSEVVQKELTQMQELYMDLNRMGLMLNVKEKREQLDKMLRLIELQQTMYMRVTLSDDPEAKRLVDQVKNAAAMLGMPKEEIGPQFYDKLKENVRKMMKAFVKRVKMNKRTMINFLNKKNKEGKKIFLYGASTKGNTLLQYYNITNKLVPYAAERSPEKWKKYTVGTGIKIISEKKARKLNPDFFLVTPWGFLNEFKKREIKWRKMGGKFIIPFPKMRIV